MGLLLRAFLLGGGAVSWRTLGGRRGGEKDLACETTML